MMKFALHFGNNSFPDLAGAHRLVRQLRKARADDWRRVPPPNWACRRGGRDYL